MTSQLPESRPTVAVCGGGLIGASLVLALGARGHEVRVSDRDATVLADLQGIVDAAGLTRRVQVHADWLTAATDADIVIAAVPPTAIPDVLAAAAPVARPDALLTDVAGVKSTVLSRVSDALGTSDGAVTRYIGGHPMAGSERSGPAAGDADLFSGATWVLTPTVASADDALARAGDLARGLGARVLVLTSEEHDTIVGLVSHLPQLVASVLADVAADALGVDRDAVMAVAGPGFRDTTRIAASDPGLWLDIVEGNREAIVRALDVFRSRLDLVVDAVQTGDDATLEEVLRRASAARQRLVPKELDEASQDLIVPLRDRPGEIARISGALGSAGINIEDLAMRHASARDRGSLLIRIRASAVDRAIGVLRDAEVEGVVVDRDPLAGEGR
jgi:prephenate dehydrogenase